MFILLSRQTDNEANGKEQGIAVHVTPSLKLLLFVRKKMFVQLLYIIFLDC